MPSGWHPGVALCLECAATHHICDMHIPTPHHWNPTVLTNIHAAGVRPAAHLAAAPLATCRPPPPAAKQGPPAHAARAGGHSPSPPRLREVPFCQLRTCLAGSCSVAARFVVSRRSRAQRLAARLLWCPRPRMVHARSPCVNVRTCARSCFVHAGRASFFSCSPACVPFGGS